MAYASVSRRRLFGSVELVLGAIFAGGMMLATIASPLLFPDGGESMDLMARLLPPFQEPAHLLGTDPLGRDMLARVIVGGKISLTVGLVSMLGSAILGSLIGLFAGYYRGIAETLLMRFTDVQLALPFILVAIMFLAVLRILSLAGVSFPNFWLAIMMVLLFSIVLGLLPPSGLEGPQSFIMPTVTMALIFTAANVRLVRTAMLETLSQQYIMVAHSKGLKDWIVLYKHALRNSAIPLVTYIGLQFGRMIGSLVIVERVFNWPGMGTLAIDAISGRDYPVLQAVVTVLALFIVFSNLVVDIAYGLIDPRIRTE